MEPCSTCGAAHAPAAAGQPWLPLCLRALALAGRDADRNSRSQPGAADAGDRSTQAASTTVAVPLGGAAGGSGSMK